jgi:cell division protein FtsZ
MGILTVAVITQPFVFEGKRRLQQAQRGLKELLDSVDTMIVIPNEKLLAVAKDAGFFESFRIADDVLRQGVQGISDIITIPGIINRDFADVKTTMAGMGHAVMGTATGSGPNRAVEAAQAAMASPLLEAGAIDGARGILINITGSSALKLSEVNAASSLIQTSAHEDANIIFGAVLDERMGDEVKITVIATGFRDQMPERRARMLDVGDATVISVPVVAAENWMRDPGQPVMASVAVKPVAADTPAATPVPAPAEEVAPAPRFMSEEEESELEPEIDDCQQPVLASVAVAPAPARIADTTAFDALFADHVPVGPARPKFAELSEEPAFKPLPRDYATDFGTGVRPAATEDRQAVGALFADKSEAGERDLEVPTFMRRVKF